MMTDLEAWLVVFRTLNFANPYAAARAIVDHLTTIDGGYTPAEQRRLLRLAQEALTDPNNIHFSQFYGAGGARDVGRCARAGEKSTGDIE